MKRLLSLLLASLLLLSALASCQSQSQSGDITTEQTRPQNPATQPPTEEITQPPTEATTEESTPPTPTVPPTQLPETTLSADLSCFGTAYKLYKLTDLSEGGLLEAKEGDWTVETDKTPVTLLAKRSDGGSQYQAAKWTFDEKQNWSAYTGILFHVDFSAASTDTFHGAVIRVYSELNGIPVVYQPGEEMTVYSSADGVSWTPRTSNEKDDQLMHVSLDKKFSGYVYIPFHQYQGLNSVELITAIELNVARVTSGETRFKEVTLVTVENPYDKPQSGSPVTDDALKDVTLDKLVTSPSTEVVTNFADVGAGKIENVGSDTVLSQSTNGFVSVVRDGGDWIQEFDWVFDTPQNWTGMAGVLVKVDYTKANTNGTTGGHGLTLGIRTAEGTSTVFNAPALGGYVYIPAKAAWLKMGVCNKHSNMLVVDPTVTNRFAGFVFIPYSAFGTVEGLDSVQAISLYVGASTSGTSVVESVWLVKGTEITDPDYQEKPSVTPDLDGTPVKPESVTSPVDLNGVVSDGSTAQVTDFNTVGKGGISNAVGTVTVTDGKLSVVRDGSWYDSFDWTFVNAQDWSGAAGILVKVDFTAANTDTNAFHGIGFTLYTKALGNGGAAMEPAKGAYLNTGDMWNAMEICSSADAKDYLGGGKRYAGYIFIPFSSLNGLNGLEHVTGFNLKVGALTSGTAYVEGVYLVSGTVQVVNQLDAWLAESKKEQNNTVLEGITVNALGDSYFAGNGLNPAYVWPQLLATKYNATLNNYGKNGSTMTNYITTKNPMCERYKAMALGSDIILVEGGRNDFNNNVPIGTIDSYDTTTFMGALNTVIKGLKESNPNAMIVVVTCWNFPGTNSTTGYTYADYANAMLAVAEAHGVYSINASDPSVIGVDMTDSEFKKQYSMTPTDISHLNLAGMMLVMPKFEALIAQYYTEFLSTHEKVEEDITVAETQWHKGYVGSAANTSWAGKINTSAKAYSYTDVIVIEKAGTTVTFTDDATGFASGSAYVLSFWKQVDGEWVIDDSKTHYAGGSSIQTAEGSTMVYSYTTESDNECIRLCYRSEHTDTFTPAFPTVILTNNK